MIPIINRNSQFESNELVEGFIVLINKESGITSFDVVSKLRQITGIKKIGHSGTLDPFATGLLIMGVGRGTKQLSSFSALSKRYRACIRFGIETDTYDITGNVISQVDTNDLDRKDLENVINEMKGEMDQLPPMYSAKKIDGKPLYKLARKGIEVERKPNRITISEANILGWNDPVLEIDLHVSKGTYIRAYAHDMGRKLKVGACLEELERTAIDRHQLTDSFTVNEFKKFWELRAA